MPQRATSIHIPQPCAESWAAMTPRATGHHCAACQKTVVDFTQKTDAEILAYLAQATGKTCGRFRPEQVGRPLAARRPAVASRRWQVWLAGLLAATLTTQSCQTLTGEPVPISRPAHQEITPDSVSVEAVSLDHAAILLAGNVVDAKSQLPVAGATVRLKNTSLRAKTNAAGYFCLPGAEQVDFDKTLLLEIHSVGYPPCEQTVSPASTPPASGLVAVLTTFPLPTMLLGDVEELR